jgi:hypothetical protein
MIHGWNVPSEPGRQGHRLWLTYGCRLSGAGISRAGMSPGNSLGRAIMGSDQHFGFSFFWAEDRAEVRAVQCRRGVCSIERLRERQEAAGNGLRN